MENQKPQSKKREWLKRYVPAEILGTIGALLAAWVVYNQTSSFVAAAAAGWIGEGIGFFGYFITFELVVNSKKYKQYSVFKRISLIIVAASTNLIVEFLPAEIIDNLIIRPYLMYLIPQYIHPYPLGFLVAKFTSDILFYALAIIGYEARKRWVRK